MAAAAVAALPTVARRDAPIVVVGAGPAGLRVVQELLRHGTAERIVLCGAEAFEPYDRVGLSSFLMGEIGLGDLRQQWKLPESDRLEVHLGCRVVEIDRDARCVVDASGRVHEYARLVLALGSSARVPNTPGVELPGVFTFRDFRDAERLFARRMRSRHTVVIGGGLLGLEAARAMHRFGTRVTVVDHNDRLMARQLDAGTAAALRERVEALGIEVVTGSSVRAIVGHARVQGIELRGGMHVLCDTVVLATGIKPNVELARRAGLHVGRGIRIGDDTRTSDDSVFAVGECAEHRDVLYGLVAPGLEQASVAAANLSGRSARYPGSTVATRLKVVGVPVFSAGCVAEEDRSEGCDVRVHRAADGSRCASLVSERGRLVGAAVVGADWETARLQDAVLRRRRVWPWQRWRFERTGQLWSDGTADNVAAWPAGATVCNCMGVTRGQLTAALRAGCGNAAALTAATGAGGVCGSCRPLLQELAGGAGPLSPVAGARWLVTLGVLAAVIALALILPSNLPDASSMEIGWHLSALWRDALLKQFTGYTLLGAGALSLIVSLRKRWRRFRFAQFAAWRVAHVVIGTLTVGLLAAHTGGRLGSNLNFALAAAFGGLVALGALSSLIVANEHRLGAAATPLRRRMVLAHIVLAWPLPALITFHVLKAYFF